MATSRAKKTAILQKLKQVKRQKSIFLFTAGGNEPSVLNAEKNHALRSAARRSDSPVVIQLVKNTLLAKVFDLPKLSSQTYISYLEDESKSNEVIVPKIMVKILEKFKDETTILGSIINGEFCDPAKTLVLANTPTLQESMATLAGMLQQGFAAKIARAVQEVPAGIARGVKAAKVQSEV